MVLITGHASLETSIEALRLGAADYLVKPINMKQLQGMLSRVMKPAALKAEVDDAERQARHQRPLRPPVGQSAPMQRIYEQISRVAGTDVTVFITGESGTGKEVVAQTVHDLSRRRKQPFLAVNCGAISPNLIESELFGHEKGSFTGADRQHQGYFERANGGTLFLDEITEMPLELQVKLLRVLETGRFMRVGCDAAARRPTCASSPPPTARRDQAVAQGKLREDLLYRLNVFPDRPAAAARAARRRAAAGRALPRRRSASSEGQAQALLGRRAASSWRPTTGRATCASCATWCSAPTSWRAGEVINDELAAGEQRRGAGPAGGRVAAAGRRRRSRPASAGGPVARRASGLVTLPIGTSMAHAERRSSWPRCATTTTTRSAPRPCSASA